MRKQRPKDTLRPRGDDLARAVRNLRAAGLGAVGAVRTRAEEIVQVATAAVLHRLGVPTHDEVRRLIQRVDQLSARIQHKRAGR